MDRIFQAWAERQSVELEPVGRFNLVEHKGDVWASPEDRQKFEDNKVYNSDPYADSWEDEAKVYSNGAQSSKLNQRFDLLPAEALACIAEVLALGADKYGEYNWEGLPISDNINHATRHMVALNQYTRVQQLRGQHTQPTDSVIEHAAHAACRALFTLQQLLTVNKDADEF